MPATYRINDPEEVRSFLNLSQKERDSFEFIAGHMPHGVHRYLTRKCRYVVFLRDPVERVVSAHFHVRRLSQHALNARVLAGMTLAEFAREARANDNGQTRRLGQYPLAEALHSESYWWLSVPNGAVGEAHLQQALATLAACDFVGFTETFNVDASRLFQRLGLDVPQVVARLNETVDRPRIAEIDSETLASIRRANQIDLRLYAEARQSYGSGRRSHAMPDVRPPAWRQLCPAPTAWSGTSN